MPSRKRVSSIEEAVYKLYPIVASILIGVLGGIGVASRIAPGFRVITSPDSTDAWRLVASLEGLEAPPTIFTKMLVSIASSLGIAPETAVALLPPILWLVGYVPAVYAGYRISGSIGGALIAALAYSLTPSLYAVTVGGRLFDGTLAAAATSLVVAALALASRVVEKGRAALIGAAVLAFLAGLLTPINGLGIAIFATILVFSIVAAPKLGWDRAAAPAMAALAGSVAGGSLLLHGFTIDFLIILLAAILPPLSWKASKSGLSPFWVLLGALSILSFSLFTGLASPPPELGAILMLEPPNAETVIQATASPASLYAVLRDAPIWWALLLVALPWAAYKLTSGRGDVPFELLLASLAAGIVVAALHTTINSELAPVTISLLAPASAYAVRALRDMGLTVQGGDELGRVVVLSAIVAVAVTSAYMASALYEAFQTFTPSPLAGASLSPGFGGVATSWGPALEMLNERIDGDSIVILTPYYAPLVEALLGVDAPSTRDSSQELFTASRVLTGTEGEANYVLREVLNAVPGNTYVVVYEAFFGAYDLNNQIMVLYPRPVVRSVPETSLFFQINGIYDMNNLFTLLKAGERVAESEASPFNTGWSSEFPTQGAIVQMFPAFIGEPADNVERTMKTLMVKLLLDAVNEIGGEETVFGEGCGFLAGRPSALFGVFTPSQAGGQIQPVFQIDLPYSFEPLVISISCPTILNETENRIEFYAEVVAVYVWTGSP